MAFVVIYDACVLYPAPLRDLLIRVAQSGIVRARWTSQILDECFRSILAQRPELKPAALARTRELMTEAVPDCMVGGHEHLIESLEVLDVLRKNGLIQSVAKIRELYGEAIGEPEQGE